MSCCNEVASSRRVCVWALNMAFSFSRKLALVAISSSLAFLASRDFLAAWLFLFRLSKYLLSFWSLGIGFFSLLGLFWFWVAAIALAMVGLVPEMRNTSDKTSTMTYTRLSVWPVAVFTIGPEPQNVKRHARSNRCRRNAWQEMRWHHCRHLLHELGRIHSDVKYWWSNKC